MFDPDQIDRLLRRVSSPSDLEARLKSVAREQAEGEAAVDELLTSVPVPENLEARICDSVLDESLRRVPVPRSVIRHFQVANPRRRWVAVAASLAAIVMVAWIAIRFGPTTTVTDPPLWVLGEPIGTTLVGYPLKSASEIAWDDDTPDLPQLDSAVGLTSFQSAFASMGPAGRLARDLGGRWDPWQDTFRLSWPGLGFDPGSESIGASNRSRLPVLRGVRARNLNAENRALMLRLGTHVPMFPGLASESMVIDAPLGLETASYDWLRDELREGRILDPYGIRVEDFLAATALPQATPAVGQLAIRTAAGPAPFGRGGSHLLQIAVQAGAAPGGDRPTHWVVAIDISASMNTGGRYDTVVRVLDEFRHDLSDNDRLSVVLFNEKVDVPVCAARRSDIPELLRVLAQFERSGVADPGPALGEAIGLLNRVDMGARGVRRLVVVSDDSGLELPSDELDALMARAGGDSIDVQWILIGQRAPQTDQWPEGARVSMAGSSLILRRSFGRALAGRPNLVARNARLSVTFNPGIVRAYRLVGHELGLTSVAAPNDGIELDGGQSASVLFEIWMDPHADDQRVAAAELVWTDPVQNQPRTVRQPISRVQFAPVVNQAPLSLQMATLVAELAERLADGVSFDIRPDGRITTYRKPREFTSLDAVAVSRRLSDYRGFHDYEDVLRRLQRLARPESR